MIKIFSTLFLFLGLAAHVFAQQVPMYSQYVFNGLLINPAYAGSREVLTATALYRSQWINIPGAPITGTFSVDSPIRNEKVGLGLNLVVDKISITSHTGISGVYSYKINMGLSSLSFGLQAGVGFYNSNNTELDPNNESVTDPSLLTNYHKVLPNFSFGTYYRTNRFYAGFSIMDILGQTIQNELYPNMANDLTINIVSHYFLHTGYLFNLSPDIKIQPSILLKYVAGSPLEVDINTVVSFYDLLHLGASYRSNASINFLFQVNINKQLSLGYSYEYPTNELSNFTKGSQEIALRYQFDFSKRKILSPRFF